MEPTRFDHDHSSYERPDFKYRCGRAARWGKPCARGANIDGSCGGVSECDPFFDGAGYECRRPPAAGGPCAEGPRPDGSCGIRRPACAPRRSLRIARGRTSLLFGLFALAAIVGLTGAGFWSPPRGLDMIDPGQLSGAHARFTEATGCRTCHATHEGDVGTWIEAAFSTQDLSGACLKCHAFDGPADRPHNAEMIPRRGPAQTTCVACHSEHRGQGFDIAELTDERCNACHKAETRFASFAKNHPAFGKSYPYETPMAVKFDHVTHLSKHFPTKGDKREASQTCLSCHDVSRAGRGVPVTSFERMCADCHGEDIGRKPLVLLTLPEFETDLLDLTEEEEASLRSEGDGEASAPEMILEACGTDLEALETLEALLSARKAGEEPEDGDAEDYLSIGEDEPTPLDAFLLDMDPEDLEVYWAPYRDLLRAMTQDGAEALEALVEERFGPDSPKALLAGLSALPVTEAACAWAANEEYEPPAKAAAGPGWAAEELRISYRPRGHEDPLLRAWLEAAVALAPAGGEAESDRISALRGLLLSEEDGPGTCAYCHRTPDEAASMTADAARSEAAPVAIVPVTNAPVAISWAPSEADRPHVRYVHKPHINLMGPGSRCTSCHELKTATASGAGQTEGGTKGSPHGIMGGFAPIAVGACKDCHKDSGVRQNCQTCHQYHREASFRKGML